jgi:hypothetical protein
MIIIPRLMISHQPYVPITMASCHIIKHFKALVYILRCKSINAALPLMAPEQQGQIENFETHMYFPTHNFRPPFNAPFCFCTLLS